MNIQIFGTKKDSDSRKAERYFKERNISFQFTDMKVKGMSRGEFDSVCHAVGGLANLIDRNCKDQDLIALINYIADDQKADKVFENQKVIKLPIVRNGRQATVGYVPEVWKVWS